MVGWGGGQERECHPIRVASVVILWISALLVSLAPVPARPPDGLLFWLIASRRLCWTKFGKGGPSCHNREAGECARAFQRMFNCGRAYCRTEGSAVAVLILNGKRAYFQTQSFDLHELMGSEENLCVLGPGFLLVFCLGKIVEPRFPFGRFWSPLEKDRIGEIKTGGIVRC